MASFVQWLGLVRYVHRMMVAGALALVAAPAHAGELGSLRSETQGSGSSDDSSSSDDSGSSDDSSSADGALVTGVAMMEVYLEEVHRLYTRYPYANGARGFVLIVEPEDEDPPGQRLSGTFTLDGATLGPTVARAGADVELMVRRFGLAFDLSPHLETRPLDALSLGSAAFMIGMVLLPRVQVHAGIGANVMLDGRVGLGEERVDAFGVNGTFRASVFPARPVVLRARVDAGQLGVAPALLGRVTAGVLLRRFELFGGYEARSVGEVRLHGPTVGARVWF